MKRSLPIIITAVLAFFFTVPLALLLYGGLAGALGGLAVIGLCCAFQWPLFAILMKLQHCERQPPMQIDGKKLPPI